MEIYLLLAVCMIIGFIAGVVAKSKIYTEKEKQFIDKIYQERMNCYLLEREKEWIAEDINKINQH